VHEKYCLSGLLSVDKVRQLKLDYRAKVLTR